VLLNLYIHVISAKNSWKFFNPKESLNHYVTFLMGREGYLDLLSYCLIHIEQYLRALQGGDIKDGKCSVM